MRWRSGNDGLLDNDQRAWFRLNAYVHAEGQRPAGSARVSRRQPEQHRAREPNRQARDDLSRCQPATGLVTPAHLAKDQRAGPAENPAQPELRQHAVDLVWALVDVLEKQHAAVRWIEGVRGSKGRDERNDGPAVQRTMRLTWTQHVETVWRQLQSG